MNIEIIKATSNDVSKANEFLTRLIRDEKQYDSNINEKFLVNSYYESIINNSNKCLLVAKKENEIIGCLYGYLIDNGDTVLNKVSRLDALFVDEGNRGLKISTKLINEFKNWSSNNECRYVEVEIFNQNIVGYNIYKNNGFKEVKTIMSLDMDNK